MIEEAKDNWMHITRRASPRVVGRACLAVFALMLVTGCASTHFRMLTSVEQHYPSASDCAECHVEIYKEWNQSAHSVSYSSETFQRATNGYAFDDCIGCHAPVSIHGAEGPKAREPLRAEGVSCVVCHLSEGKLKAPIDPTAAIVPH